MTKKIIALAGVSLLLVACSNAKTTLMPEGGNKYTVVSTSSSEGDSQKACMKKATQVCKEQEKSVAVSSSQTVYQGIDKDEASKRNMVSTAVNSVLGTRVSGGSTENDYKTVTKFECV